jgi:hypothetical protein
VGKSDKLLGSKHPDIVRQNCYIALSTLNELTQDRVKIAVSEEYSEKVKRQGLDVLTARVSFVSGVLPYFKKSVLKDFYTDYFKYMEGVGHVFSSYDKHGDLLSEFQEFGGLTYCHEDVLFSIIEWLCLCYIGERSFGQYSVNRKVFFSNVGAPLSLEILTQSKVRVSEMVCDVIEKSKSINIKCQWLYCQRRSQEILDAIA